MRSIRDQVQEGELQLSGVTALMLPACNAAKHSVCCCLCRKTAEFMWRTK